MNSPTKKIVARECRFANHFQSILDESDIHVVKERIHFEDGTSIDNMRILKDEKMPFYITKPGQRNYQEKKEWIEIDRCDRYESTQTKLAENIAKALRQPWLTGGVRQICDSPYVFGADIPVSSYIKKKYKDAYPDKVTPFRVAVFDTETDMLGEVDKIIMATISHKERSMTVVLKEFVQGFADPIRRVTEKARELIGDTLDARKLVPIFKFVDTEIEILKELMKFANELEPDLMAVWNIEFDMDKIVEACHRAGIEPKDLLSDPRIPFEYRQFTYVKGKARKLMNSGRPMNFKPSQRWHKIQVPSSFFWIDAMCTYRQVRTGAAEEPKYDLDSIANKHLKLGKLKFTEADHIPSNTAQWHSYMQRYYKFEYIVYNLFDCIVVEMLDEVTYDLAVSLPMFSVHSPFEVFNSQPKRAFNEIHWTALARGFISGSTGSDMTTEEDDDVTDVTGWIVMLPSELIVDNGLRIVDEDPELPTNVRTNVADLDVEGAYPTNEDVMNVSKGTTTKELIEIEGIPEKMVRMQTINFSGGYTNALEFCQVMHSMPTLDELVELV